ncbi:hypothetical protein MCOR04_008418 [Pyricularia oryzae]|nr:hypothetical protein MCOR30_007372 [Pyricularia oryzae]KAI6486519.1 hypothetical protein MCOR13_009431 [Pyricularia oryzae]KAI6569102.1 hypothetical protein MCOR04_008418 [Pyricularia oryzae]KAI6594336.1 hypothetical protein MCOR12_006920 [Pyricularia oryzae]
MSPRSSGYKVKARSQLTAETIEMTCREYLAWDWSDLSNRDCPHWVAQWKSRKATNAVLPRLSRTWASGPDKITQTAFDRAKEIISNELVEYEWSSKSRYGRVEWP